MPAAKQSGRTTRGRASSNGSRSRAQTRQANRSASRPQTSRKRTSNGSRARSAAGRNRSSSGSGRSTAGSSRSSSGNGTLVNVGISALSATIGVAGGVLLGRTALQRGRKVLGLPVPEKIDLGGVGQQIGEAGRQFGKLAGEIRSVREKAEQVGKLLT